MQITPTHYFGALAMVLDRADSYDPANAETTDSILFLLSVVLPEVPPAILRRQGARVSKLLAAITQSNKEEQGVVRHAVDCMGVILHVAIASPQYWQDEPTAKVSLALGSPPASQLSVHSYRVSTVYRTAGSFCRDSQLEINQNLAIECTGAVHCGGASLCR